MSDFNDRPSFRERIQRFMLGRYGTDGLYYFLLTVCFVLVIINFFVGSFFISLVEMCIFGYMMFRFLSKNVYKRQQENRLYAKYADKPIKFVKLLKCMWRDRKTHVYKKCPSCRNNLRLPKQVGKHTVECPCCKARFDVKI